MGWWLWIIWGVFMRRRTLAAALVFAVVGAAACGAESEEPSPDSWDPSSTDEVIGPGFAAAAPRELHEVAAEADAALIVTVTDVMRPRFSTATGDFPSEPMQPGRNQLLSELFTITPVAVTVEEIIGVNPFSQLNISAGDEVVISVPGGGVTYTLTREQMAALGFTPDEFEDGDAPADLPDSAELFRGVGPSIRINEGDQLLVFVLVAESVTVDDEWNTQRVTRIVPVSSLSGTFLVAGNSLMTVPIEGAAVELSLESVRDVARALNAATTPPTPSG